METYSILNVLVVAAFALLAAVTGGIAYLTVVDWRDRRRQEKDKRLQQRPGAKPKQSKQSKQTKK